jgi:hypothetical protein
MPTAADLLRNANTLFARDGGVHPPPEVLLSWPNPNFVNPEERGWEAPIVLIVMMVITSIIFIARLWARFMVAKNLGLDDILMGIAMLPVLGLTVSAILGTLGMLFSVLSDLIYAISCPATRISMARLGPNK